MNRIKQLREENNWTQLELSQKMDCAKSTIAMYEKGDRKPSLEVLIKLSEIFNCSIDYILCKTDIRNIEEDFKFAYHKETEGLSEDEIKETAEILQKLLGHKNITTTINTCTTIFDKYRDNEVEKCVKNIALNLDLDI